MNEDLKKILKTEISDATVQAFSSLKKNHSGENICAFALYSDSGAMTVSPSANTMEHLSEAQADDPDDPVYYRWSPTEWAYEFEGAELFNNVSSRLREELKNIPDEDSFEIFKNDLFNLCVEVLLDLKKKGVFQNEILVFSVTNYQDDAKEIAWIKKLNSKKDADEFSEWVSSQ